MSGDNGVAGVSSALAELVDRLAARVQAGERIDLEAVLAEHPEHAEQLRRLLPAVGALDELSRSARPGQSGAAPAAPGDSLAEGGTLGDFRIVREVGRGGMGVVYEAEQLSLKRRVALKVLPFAATLDPRRLTRFHNEAVAAASLHHDHIVAVHAVGCERGTHYYAMGFVDGRTLAQVIATRRKSAGAAAAEKQGTEPYRQGEGGEARPSAETVAAASSTLEQETGKRYHREVARLGIEAAEALEHAHALGVVHRDVKPGNLMLDGRGKLWVTDFGLARLADEPGVTVSGDLLGTLRYMSPEQALARHGLVDHRTDVYSLGVTLYELLTLRPAVGGKDRQEVLRNIAFEEPAAPRRLQPAVPRDQETVVLKAMAKNPRERYATAKELADDLRRFLEDRPIRARRPGLGQRLRKWARRHRAVVGAAAVCLLVAGAALAGSVGWAAGERRAQRKETARVVEAALADAEDWLGKDRPYEALSAALRAEGLLRQAGGHPGLQPLVDEMLWDVRLLLRLERARLSQSAVRDGDADWKGADEDYERAFAEFGLDVLAGNAADAVECIKGRQIAVELAAFLDHWALVRRAARGAMDPGWRKLLDVARQADPDVGRARFREALSRRDTKGLTRLAQAGGLDGLSATSLTAYYGKGAPPQVVALLRRAQRQRPDDFWVNHTLASALRDLRPAHLEEAIGFYRAAVALRPQSPGALLHLGIGLEKKGRLDEAIACFEDAIRLKPDYAEAHTGRGYALAKKGKVDEAIACLKEAIHLKPALAEAHNNLGLALGKKGEVDEAIACYSAAICLQPDFAEAHTNLGVELEEKGRLDEAVACHRVAIRLQPDFAGPHYNLGIALGKKGKLDEAVVCYQEAIRRQPGFAEAHSNLGNALRDKGKLEEAIACCREAVRLKPDLAEAHTNLGNALRDKGEVDEAVVCYQEAIRRQPDYAEAHSNLGNALRDKGEVDEAIACHRVAICLKPDSAAVYSNLGAALREKGKLEEAIACYKQAIRLQPDFAMAHTNLGNALRDKGKLNEAIACYRAAIRLQPDLALAHCNLGAALRDKGEVEEAIACLKEAICLKPDNAAAHSRLGAALRDKGEVDEAIACYKQAILLQPDFAMAHTNLGSALADKGELDEAIACLKEAIRLQPGSALAKYGLGYVLGKKGRLDEAIACYKQAIRLQPDYAEAHCNLGDALQRQGRFTEALDARRRGHELGSKRPGWPFPSAQWVRVAEFLVELDRKLPAVLQGKQRPADAAEAAALAELCLGFKKRPASAALLYQEALAAAPKLAEDLGAGHRYNAACAAVLAGCGQGKDAAGLGEMDRLRWRRQALTWLHADLRAWQHLLDRDQLKARTAITQTMRHWLADPDFNGVRGEEALARLPAEERDAWARLWADVADLLARTKDPTPKEKEKPDKP
jgi:tetratricopeptide (TPR) repeat protein/serine/threonine protein kinase